MTGGAGRMPPGKGACGRHHTSSTIGVMQLRERCDDWTTAAEITATGTDTSTYDAAVVANAITAASDWFYRVTFGQYPGECQITIRPCGHNRGCRVAGLPMLNGYRPPCQCGAGDIAVLPYGPIVSIDAVVVDGDTLVADTDYRYVNPNWLVRIDAGWPGCNNPEQAPTAVGAWYVTYTAGLAPPQMGRFAASSFAAEILKSTTGDCALPPGAVRATGLGVTIDLTAQGAASALFPVAAFFEAYPRRAAPKVGVVGRNGWFVEPTIAP